MLCAPKKCIGSLALIGPRGCKYYLPEGFGGEPTECQGLYDVFTDEFFMYAVFQPDCTCCRYKQSILGSFDARTKNRNKWGDWITSEAGKAGTPAGGYDEDKDKEGNVYGTRPGPGYSADGCTHEDCDVPGPVDIGDFVNNFLAQAVQIRFHYKFLGQIIATDDCMGGVVAELSWETECAMEFTTPFNPPFAGKFKVIPYPP
jgi:hypothetical protein